VNGPRLFNLRSASARSVHDKDVGQRSRNVEIFVRSVEEDDYLIAVCERAAPDVCFADAELIFGDVRVARHALDSFPARILADGDDGWVVDDGEGLRAHLAEVVAEEEWGFQCCPHGEVCFVLEWDFSMVMLSVRGSCFAYLLVSHATQANFEHVQVVPAARQTAIDVRRDLVDDGENRAVCARSDAVGIRGISASTKIIWSGKGVVDVSRNTP